MRFQLRLKKTSCENGKISQKICDNVRITIKNNHRTKPNGKSLKGEAVLSEEASADVEKTLDTLDLTDASWNLLIHSYGPGEDENDPSVSKITDVDFGEQKLGKWKDIAATEDQLNELGVTDMLYVSGVGEYTTTFTLPEDWSDTTGAYLDVTYGKDQIGEITINGTALDANNASDRVDLGGYLVSGENTLTIKLSTTLYARMYAANSGYEGRDFGMVPDLCSQRIQRHSMMVY